MRKLDSGVCQICGMPLRQAPVSDAFACVFCDYDEMEHEEPTSYDDEPEVALTVRPRDWSD